MIHRNGAKTGVYICHCGTNIAPKVNVEEVTEFAQPTRGRS
jgi:heterodisulfide reductase subunit A-like polyferredoxin